jgi:hypothetical protein
VIGKWDSALFGCLGGLIHAVPFFPARELGSGVVFVEGMQDGLSIAVLD